MCKSCRSRKMLQNAPTLAIVAVHTEENEPLLNFEVILFGDFNRVRTLREIDGAKVWGDVKTTIELLPRILLKQPVRIGLK